MMNIFVVAVSILKLFVSAEAIAHETPDAELFFQQGAIHAHLFWEQGPNNGTESVMRIEFMNGHTHSPTEIPSTFDLDIWMPDMGHGSAPTQTQRVLNERGEPLPGVYRVNNIYFVMGGAWDVRLKLKEADGKEEMQILKVEIGGGMHHHH